MIKNKHFLPILSGVVCFIILFRTMDYLLLERFKISLPLSGNDAVFYVLFSFGIPIIVSGLLVWRISKHPAYTVEVFSALLMVLLVGEFLYYEWDSNIQKRLVPLSIIVTGVIAAAGWIYGGYQNRKLSRRQHTYTTIRQFRDGIFLEWHRKHITSFFDQKNPMSDEAFRILYNNYKQDWETFRTDRHVQHHLIDSATLVANWYEYLCAALKNGDLDENLIRDTLKTIMTNYYWTVYPLIRHYQKQSETAFENYTMVIEKRWCESRRPEFSKRKSIRSAKNYVRHIKEQKKIEPEKVGTLRS